LRRGFRVFEGLELLSAHCLKVATNTVLLTSSHRKVTNEYPFDSPFNNTDGVVYGLVVHWHSSTLIVF